MGASKALKLAESCWKNTSTITIDEAGHIRIPLEANQKLNLEDNEWLQVSVKSDHIEINPSSEELDEDLIEALIHEGVIIDIK
jgi:bifunctional DNA-binding transcriptional regulator/antitoxin component of YhaV-PrlF toxin-antitoxin module